MITAIGAHVLDCWRRGVPVGPGIGVSLHANADGEYRLRCGNLHCDDEFADGEPALLLVGEDGQDIARSHSVEELGEIAHEMGWRDLGHGLWLCATCAVTHQAHQPTSEHAAR